MNPDSEGYYTGKVNNVEVRMTKEQIHTRIGELREKGDKISQSEEDEYIDLLILIYSDALRSLSRL